MPPWWLIWLIVGMVGVGLGWLFLAGAMTLSRRADDAADELYHKLLAGDELDPAGNGDTGGKCFLSSDGSEGGDSLVTQRSFTELH